jgi:tetrahydromethanopterin S-methyltransferase subunit F
MSETEMGVLRAIQNDLEERARDMYAHARKNESGIIKKVMSRLFVGILLASVLIGILTVVPEKVRAEIWSITTVDANSDVGFFSSMKDRNFKFCLR